jgi:phage terminase large subunit-like protein
MGDWFNEGFETSFGNVSNVKITNTTTLTQGDVQQISTNTSDGAAGTKVISRTQKLGEKSLTMVVKIDQDGIRTREDPHVIGMQQDDVTGFQNEWKRMKNEKPILALMCSSAGGP